MAIPYPDQSDAPVGDYVHRTFAANNTFSQVVALKEILVDAGWTYVGEVSAYLDLYVTGAANNGGTVTIDGAVYVWRTTIDNGVAREVLIESTPEGCVDNLVAAIMGGSGSGTKYSSATTAHATCSASKLYVGPAGVNAIARVYYKVAGNAGNFVSVSENMANGVFYSSYGTTSVLMFGGYRLRSARAAGGLQVGICIGFFHWSGRFVPLVQMGNPESSGGGNTPGPIPDWSSIWVGDMSGFSIDPAYGTYHVVAHKFGAWVWTQGTVGVRSSLMFGIPCIPDDLQGQTITAASGGGGTIVTVTQPGHGRQPGFDDNVYIAGAAGLNIDGYWACHVVDSERYTLTNSDTVAAGTYSPSSAYGAFPGRIARAWYLQGGASVSGSYRQSADGGWTQTSDFICVNQYSWTNDNRTTAGSTHSWYNSGIRWTGDRWWMSEVQVVVSTSAVDADVMAIGMMYAAGNIAKGVPADSYAVDVDGKKWFLYSRNSASNTGLWIRVPDAEN